MVLEAASLAFSVAQTLLATLQSSQQLKQLFSMYGHKSELESLERTVKTIRSVLRDADAKEALSHQEIDFVEQLKDAVYDADDLIDEFATLAMQHEQLLGNQSGGFSEKVRDLFIRFKKLPARHKIFGGVKKIQKRLDDIASNADKFCFKVDNKPIRRRREESCSDLYKDRIIGRGKELDEIVSMLLSPGVLGNNVSFLTIVGIGGLGKTTLAQLMYHHEIIKEEFFKKWWVCVADEDQKPLDVEGVLRKILDVATSQGNHDSLSKEVLAKELYNHLNGKKFLLILDDVWNEDRNEWLKLEEFLMKGGEGSWVVLTSRSKETARVVGNGHMYELRGLSKENSWDLFKTMAFNNVAMCEDEYVKFGKQIVKKCVGVPLAIRVVGSLLYGQRIDRWRSLQYNGIGGIGNDLNGVKSILEFSYHHLDTSLKSCFSYCAVFPKDFKIKKDMLIQQWMAQGYVELEDKGQSLEEIAEGYFLILLRRNFFQDVQRDEYGEIISCKMHDLMHDVAQTIGGKEIRISNTYSGDLDQNIRHLCLDLENYKDGCTLKTKIRTLLIRVSHKFEKNDHISKGTLVNFGCLRVLDLCNTYLQVSLSPINMLIHLRYLDLSYLLYKELPGSITKLYNLQTLKLSCCLALIELPKDLCKLSKLRVLATEECPLMHMPLGMSKLISLRTLTDFVVADGSSVSQVKDLGALPYLSGDLDIRINKNARYVQKDDREVGFLNNKEHLRSICVRWNRIKEDVRADDCEQLLEDLEPHSNLKKLELRNYHGVTFPRWMREEHMSTSLPHLVEIVLYGLSRLQYLPSFAKLPKLKSIQIKALDELEFMENTNSSCIEASMSEIEFFPSLKELYLHHLPKLKGWWRGVVGEGEYRLPSFSCLSILNIERCPKLTYIPLCPTVEQLELGNNKSLHQVIRKSTCTTDDDYTRKAASCSSYQLRSANLNNEYLKSMPTEALGGLVEMIISDEDLRSLSEFGEEVLRSCSFSLRKLTIHCCPKVTSLSGGGGGLGHLTALVELSLTHLPIFAGEDEDDDRTQWSSLGASLRYLELRDLPKLVNLPKGMRHLTALQALRISICSNLKTIPDWIGCLSSLEDLEIFPCPAIESIPEAMCKLTSLRALCLIHCCMALKERCKKPNGEDWPNIQHIPNICITHKWPDEKYQSDHSK